MLYFLLSLLSLIAGYAIGTLRSQREAIAAKAQLKAEQQHADEAMRKQAQALRAEFKAMSVEMMRTQGDALREQHVNSLEALLKPLGHDIEAFRTQFVKDTPRSMAISKPSSNRRSRLVAKPTTLPKLLKATPSCKAIGAKLYWPTYFQYQVSQKAATIRCKAT